MLSSTGWPDHICSCGYTASHSRKTFALLVFQKVFH
jgi:hypothetical protein